VSEEIEQTEATEETEQTEPAEETNAGRDPQRRIVEAVILASPDPISAARIAEVLPRCNPSQVRAIVRDLNEEYVARHSAFEIWEVAGGYQMRSLPEFAPYLRQIQKTRPLRLSQAALESLAIIAYRQPVTRAELEQVRGVDVGGVLHSLLERDLIRVAGHREVPGRPMVYATSRRFLEVFGLAKLGDLPALREVAELGEGEDEEEAAPPAEPSVAADPAVDEPRIECAPEETA
jgi:segregation and condensation protein B